MAYNILKSDGTLFLTLEDGQVETDSTTLTFVGKNLINYGLYQNENFLYLLENFASVNSPAKPTAGQLWFDKNADILRIKVYDGGSWKSLPNISYTETVSSPTLNSGDFWWDTTREQLFIQSGSEKILIGGSNVSSSTAGKLENPVKINGVDFDGSADITITSDTSNQLTRGNYLTGSNFNGSAATTWAVDVGNVSNADPFKVVARNNTGDIWFNVGHGVATSSRYADLAEKYIADREYEVGTVVMVGGTAEVTACEIGCRAIGVVSAKPAHLMNSDLEGGTVIAIKGRVPVKIVGPVKKGQDLFAGPDGCAVAANSIFPYAFAVALEDSNGKNIVEALVL